VGRDAKRRMRQNVVDIFMVKDNSNIDSYTLEANEVHAICICPIKELSKVHQNGKYQFEAMGINYKKELIKIQVTQNSFPYNWDNYHYKIALLADRFTKGERNLIY
jgi:hypothetical protein